MTLSLSIEKADILLEKYYEGTTTKTEEQWLRCFLQQENLPKRFDVDCAFFGYIQQERTILETPLATPIAVPITPEEEIVEVKLKPPRKLFLPLNPFLRVGLVAAALLAAVLIPSYLIQANNQNIAYVNGVKLTDKKDLKKLALASIQNLDNNEVETSVNELEDLNVMELQLAQFEAIE